MSEPRKTPTELLIYCMDEFAKVEPLEVIVVWTDEAGDLCWADTTNKLSAKVGMLECAKQYIMEKARKEEE